jgi:hypothetical protein
MITPIFACENNGSRLYKIGRVGLDTGAQDTGGVYKSTLKTERISPLGELAVLVFRRVGIRIWRTGSFTFTVTVFVDGAQTTIFDANGNKIPQTITFTQPTPTLPPIETMVEASIQAQGTYIEVQMDINSNNITGIFLPAELEVHFYPLRRARERTAQST